MFLFTPCQVGAETVLKTEIRRIFPDYRPAFSRPGFVTFKTPHMARDMDQAAYDLLKQSIFARSAARSLGSINADLPAKIVSETWQLVKNHGRYVNRIHVFRRDPCVPGDHFRASLSGGTITAPINFEPGLTQEDRDLHQALVESVPHEKFLGFGATVPEHPALPGETVLNVVRVDPGLIMVGLHVIMPDSPIQAYYPGGVLPISMPPNVVSRAWLKFEEGLRWSGFPIGHGSRCLDIGASPGGGSQALLQRGATVIGVDPAEMAPDILNHPNFTHVRGRINQIKRSLYKNVRWLISDMNVAPGYTFDVLAEILSRRDTKIQGMLFTLKLFQWKLADELPKTVEWFQRRSFDDVRIKQLAFNRQEVMVAAQNTGKSFKSV